MPKSPFIDDPRDVMKRHVALAVASPIEEVRAIHIRTAEHYAEIAKDSSLPFNKKSGMIIASSPAAETDR